MKKYYSKFAEKNISTYIDVTEIYKTKRINEMFKSKYYCYPNHFNTELNQFFTLFHLQKKIVFKERNLIKKINYPELGHLIIKSFKKPIILNQIIYRYLKSSKAKRSFYNSQYLISKNISTPKPIVYIEKKNIFFLNESYYISECFNYDFTFREVLDNRYSFSDWKNIMIQFTRFVYDLHQKEVYFKDLSPGNILIKKELNDYTFCLVDVNRMLFKKMSIEEKMNNLTRLSLSLEMIDIISKEYGLLENVSHLQLREILMRNALKFEAKKTNRRLLKEIIGKSPKPHIIGSIK